MRRMSIDQLYGGDPVISFEFFPPKTDAGFASLYREIETLKQLGPGFVSVTMGAGGSTRAKTVDLVIEIQREIGLTGMAHLPCLGFRPSDVTVVLDALAAGGVQNVLALRGDVPKNVEGFVHPSDGFDHANELVAFVKAHGGFSIGAACYPEVHPEAESAETDMTNLIRKVDAGVDFLITQLFFDNTRYFEFVERTRAQGIQVPIVPGIMPILSAAGIRRMLALGGGTLPAELEQALSEVEGDDHATAELGVRWATDQCRELLEHGVPGIHFYTLNKSNATRRIFKTLFP
jgi:methylenetetrahydrofolate reductase (NADPH)